MNCFENIKCVNEISNAFKIYTIYIYIYIYILYSWFRASSLYINKIQQDATDAVICLLQNYATCFGCPSHPSSGVHQTLTAASGTSHVTYQGNDLLPA